MLPFKSNTQIIERIFIPHQNHLTDNDLRNRLISFRYFKESNYLVINL